MSFLMEMDLDSAFNLIKYAEDKNTEELIFQRWLHFQNMGFDEFKHKLIPRKQKSEQEILNDVDNIIKEFEWR